MPTASGKFSRDVAWNVASLGIAGVAGIVLNYLISVIYDTAALGAFNQVFAAYILFSQVAALGIHLSALQHVAVANEQAERKAIATSALLVVLIQASLTAVAFFLAGPLVADLLDSADVGLGMAYATCGVVFFALNKVLLGCLNGLRRMRWYAVLTAGRFLLMLGAFGVCATLGVEAGKLPVVLSVAELGTFCFALAASRSLLGRVSLSDLRRWGRSHVSFGSRGFMSGVLSDLNTRVDVLMLGYFAGDALVGAYSFAAILIEGFFQLLTVLRSNYAPVIARMLADDRRKELVALIHRGRNRTYLAALPIGVIAALGYMLMVPLVTSDPLLHESWLYFAILAAGIVVSSGYIPFSQILLHAHRPGAHTWLMLGIVGINIAANAILIPWFGSAGAAAATAFALASSVLLLKALSWRLLRLRF